MNLTTLFIVLSMANVVLSTIRSLTTIKSGKWVASLVNAIYYGYYTIVAIYTVTLDFAIWQKVVITFGCNFIGVFFVKFAEEKMRKDKLWLVKITIPNRKAGNVQIALEDMYIPHTILTTSGLYTVFDCYCLTQNDTLFVTEMCKKYQGKAFATENRL